jgi:hypothetical protein
MSEQIENPLVDVGGKSVPFLELPVEVQTLVKTYQRWQVELNDARLEVFKLEAALRGLGAELELKFKQL